MIGNRNGVIGNESGVIGNESGGFISFGDGLVMSLG